MEKEMTVAGAKPNVNSRGDGEKIPLTDKGFSVILREVLGRRPKLNSVISSSDLEEMAEEIADEYKAQMAVQEAEALNAEGDDEWGVSAADLLAQPITTMPTLYDPILPLGAVGFLAGESDVNKSMFLRQLAICTATGKDFLGYRYNGTRRRVIYVSTEDDQTNIQFFLQRNNEFFKDEKEEWRNLRFVCDGEELYSKMEKSLSEHPAELIIIDSLADVFDDKDTNSMAQVRKFLKPYTQLARDNQCLILFLHHVGKGKENLAPSKNLLNGSQAIEAAARCVFILKKDKSVDNLRHLCIVKHNYLPPEYKKESIVLSVDPHTFTFQRTGMHVPFGELVEKSGASTKKPISDYGDDEEIKQFFAQETTKGISRTRLMNKVREIITDGQNQHPRQEKAYDRIDYAAYNKWITPRIEGKVTRYDYTGSF